MEITINWNCEPETYFLLESWSESSDELELLPEELLLPLPSESPLSLDSLELRL